MRSAVVYSALLAGASAHGVVLSIEGDNGVSMPGLSVADGTPRDCSSNGCGSQADTSIIRTREIRNGRTGPLGRTQGNGEVNAEVNVMAFMGAGGQALTNNGSSGVGVEDNISGMGGRAGAQQRRDEHSLHVRQLFGGGGLGKALGLGGGGGGAAGGGGGGGLGKMLGGIAGALGGGAGGAGGQKMNYAQETMVSDMAGQGSEKGLPTASDNGQITMVYRQINQDGAGPLTADVDGTSGGTDASAFKSAEVMQDVPGLRLAGVSLATNTNFPVTVQMPQGMTCEATVAGMKKVCVVRVHNTTPAGPFGGSAVFTQSTAGRKRAIAYRLRKRFEIGRTRDAEALAAADAAELEEDEEDE